MRPVHGRPGEKGQLDVSTRRSPSCRDDTVGSLSDQVQRRLISTLSAPSVATTSTSSKPVSSSIVVTPW